FKAGKSKSNAADKSVRPTRLFHRGTLEGAFQSLVQRRPSSFVFLLRDMSLLMLHFELKQLVLQRFEKQPRAIRGRRLGRHFRQADLCGTEVGNGCGRGTASDVDGTRGQHHSEAAEDVTAILFQRIRSVDRRTQPTSRTRIASSSGSRLALSRSGSSLTVVPGL